MNRRPVQRKRPWWSIKRKRQAPVWWNFWTPILGTIYRIRAHHPDDLARHRIRLRKIRAYYGKTMQHDWTKRIDAHMWGTHDTPAKPWADTVPGWSPNGRAEDIVAAGGADVVFRFRMVPLILSLLELWTIRFCLPVYNHQLNLGNPRRITKAEQVRQRAQRDAGGRHGVARRAVGVLRQAVGAAMLLVGALVLLAVAMTAL